MSNKNKLPVVPKSIEDIIVERNIRRTWLQRIFHTLCLLLPICFCFAGYYLSPFIFNLFNSEKESIPESFKFVIVLIFFIVACMGVFFKTRNTNPIIKIRVLTKRK